MYNNDEDCNVTNLLLFTLLSRCELGLLRLGLDNVAERIPNNLIRVLLGLEKLTLVAGYPVVAGSLISKWSACARERKREVVARDRVISSYRQSYVKNTPHLLSQVLGLMAWLVYVFLWCTNSE